MAPKCWCKTVREFYYFPQFLWVGKLAAVKLSRFDVGSQEMALPVSELLTSAGVPGPGGPREGRCSRGWQVGCGCWPLSFPTWASHGPLECPHPTAAIFPQSLGSEKVRTRQRVSG